MSIKKEFEIPTEAINNIVSTKKNDEPNDNKELTVHYGKVDSISIYEVTEYELTILEMGSPYSIYLNIFTFLCAVFLSFLTTLLTVTFPENSIVQNIFLFISIVSGALSIITFVLWKKGNKQLSNIIMRIKQRLK
jgi:hypothetical protein